MANRYDTYRGETWLPEAFVEPGHPVFADRAKESAELAAWLREPGSNAPLLVTGFRGVGKTSLVNAVLAQIAWEDWLAQGNDPRQVHLVVQIAVPRLISEAALLRRILIRTYMRLVKLAAAEDRHLRPIVAAAWLAASRAMGTVEMTDRTRAAFSVGWKSDGLTAEAEYERAMELKVSAQSSSAEDLEDDFLDLVGEIRSGAHQAGIGERLLAPMKAMQKAKGRLETWRRGEKPFRVTIVIDELDKITDHRGPRDVVRSGEEIVTELTRQLKTLLCVPDVRIILIGGVDQELGWLEQKLRPNSLLPSVFSHRLYVSAVPRERTEPGAPAPVGPNLPVKAATVTAEDVESQEGSSLGAAILKRASAGEDASGGFVPGRRSDACVHLDVDLAKKVKEKLEQRNLALPFRGEGSAFSLDLLWLAWHARWIQRRLVASSAAVDVFQDLVPGERKWIRSVIEGLLKDFPVDVLSVAEEAVVADAG